MKLFKTLARCTETALKLPVAAAWDVISLGNMGDGSSTSKVLREHQQQKQVDEFIEILKELKDTK